jgi:hypothetical protein
MDWLKQFRVEDEEGGEGGGKGKGKGGGKGKAPVDEYQPQQDERVILEAIVALAEDRVTWEGTTTELLQEISEFVDIEDFTASRLGKVLNKSESWLDNRRIGAESKRLAKGVVWHLFAE